MHKIIIKQYLFIILITSLFILSGCNQRSEKNVSQIIPENEVQTELIDKNPPKVFLDNFRTYSMAFVILADSEYNSVPNKMISVINGAKLKFSENFKRMTYNRITIDTSDDIYIINLGSISSSDKNDNDINIINQNINKMINSFDKIDSYEYISIFHTWPTVGGEVDFHENKYRKDTKLRGLNYIGPIKELENNNEEDLIDQITLALLHETSHEWGAFEGGELGILNDMWIHYNGKVIASDPLGGCPWFINKNGEIDCTYYRPQKREFLDLTLFIMGIIPESEVDLILITNEDGTYRTVTIQEIIKASIDRELSLDGTARTDSDSDGMLDWQENQGINGKYPDHLRSDKINPFENFPEDECVDLDNGVDVSTKGQTKYKSDIYQDVCFIKESSTDTTSTLKCSGTNCYVKEYYCNSKTSNPISQDISC